MTSNDLSKLPPNQALTLLTNLSSSSSGLDYNSAKVLASNVPISTSLALVVSTTAFVNIHLINNTNSSQLSSLVPQMDLHEMEPFRKGYITSQVKYLNFTLKIFKSKINFDLSLNYKTNKKMFTLRFLEIIFIYFKRFSTIRCNDF